MAGIPNVNTSSWRLPKKGHAVPEASYTDDMYRAKGLPVAPPTPTTGGSGLPVVDTSGWRLPSKGGLLQESELSEAELRLQDVMGDPRKLTRMLGGSPEQRAATAKSPAFRKAMAKLTGKRSPSHKDVLKALVALGLDRKIAGQYAMFATEKFTESDGLSETELMLKDILGDPERMTRLRGGRPDMRAATAKSDVFRKAMRQLTGKRSPSYKDVMKALMKAGLDQKTASQYAMFATEKFTEADELAEPSEEPSGPVYSEEDVVEYLRSRRSRGRVTVNELAQTFGGNFQAHTRFLQGLAEQGKLLYHRHKAGGFYTLPMQLAEPRTEGACKKSYLKKRRPRVEAMKKGQPLGEAFKHGISVDVLNIHPGDFSGPGGQSRKLEVYVTGDTYAIRDDLKKLGLRWNPNRKAWGLWGGYSEASGKKWGTPIKKVEQVIDKVQEFALKHNKAIQKGNQQKFAKMGVKAEPQTSPLDDPKQWYKDVMGKDKAVASLATKYGMAFVPEFKPYGKTVASMKMWVVGRTYDVRDILKKFGFKFSKKVPFMVEADAHDQGVTKVGAGWFMEYDTFKAMKKQVFAALFKRMTKGEAVDYRQQQRRLAGLELSEHLSFATGTPYRQLPGDSPMEEFAAVEGLDEMGGLLTEMNKTQIRLVRLMAPTGSVLAVDLDKRQRKAADALVTSRLLKLVDGEYHFLRGGAGLPYVTAINPKAPYLSESGLPRDQRALAGLTESRSLPHCVTDAAPRPPVRAHGILDDGTDGGDAFIDQVLAESRWFFRDFGDYGLGVVRPFEEEPGGRAGPWRGSDDEPAPTPIVRKGKVHGVVGKQKTPEEKGQVDVGKSEIDYDHDPDEPEDGAEDEPKSKGKPKKSFVKKTKDKDEPPEDEPEDEEDEDEDEEEQTEGKLLKALGRHLRRAGERVRAGKHATRVKAKARERLHAGIKKFKAHHGIHDRD